MKTSAQLRQAFLDYFAEHGHHIVASSPLVPANDPTLLFTNAGMVQFKETFLGQEQRPYKRATSSQRCVRAGGKHNDLENVGYTARHHTFFEMLGNFSFGDYFKREAIRFAWQFLTETLGLPEDKLWVTVYQDDPEAEAIWLEEMKVSAQRFSRCGAKDNFWSMGDTGPCGPCTEIFYDHGPHIEGGPPGSPDEDGDRYIEIWNLVFMQYDRDSNGELTPLPKPSVDTGMGLERLAAVMQGVHNNYDIDLFQHLLQAAGQLLDVSDTSNTSLRVIADHIRSTAFLIVDGVMPSNEGRGYVLRRIIRRAIRHGHQLGAAEVFFWKLTAALVKEMGDAYPELVAAQGKVEQALRQEEERFRETLEHGIGILNAVIKDLDGSVIPGDIVFKLYDTYGFPVDLTADIARERELTLDMDGYEQAMQGQRDRARAASNFAGVQTVSVAADVLQAVDFTGYQQLSDQGTIKALFRDGQPVDSLNAGEEGLLILDRSPFYAESGGQAGDSGSLKGADGIFEVNDTKKQGGEVFAHIGSVRIGSLKVGDTVSAEVNAEQRAATVLNHSATHLMHAALRQVLGDHVAQKGSLVNSDRLRFDFSQPQPVSPEQLIEVERLVNQHIRANHPVETNIMSLDDARSSGAMALFGEKYADEVRVLRMSDFSVELCGGTHAKRTGDIGLFRIVSESGVASGVRRIEAVTGAAAIAFTETRDAALNSVATLLKGNPDNVTDKVRQLLDRSRGLEKEVSALKEKLASGSGSDLADQAVDVNGVKVITARIDGADGKALRNTVDRLKDKLGDVVVVLAGVNGDKAALVAGISKPLAPLDSGALLRHIASQLGGKGGGRQDFAQGGAGTLDGLDAALASSLDWVRENLANRAN